MPRISSTKEKRIKEMILHFLFEQSPRAVFTAAVSENIARDEEYIKRLLLSLENKGLVVSIKKNPQGKNYVRRIRWRLSNQAYDAYKKMNSSFVPINKDF